MVLAIPLVVGLLGVEERRQRHLGVDVDELALGRAVTLMSGRITRSSEVSRRGLLDEVAVLEHARQLGDPLELQLAPRAAHLRLAQGRRQGVGLAAQLLAGELDRRTCSAQLGGHLDPGLLDLAQPRVERRQALADGRHELLGGLEPLLGGRVGLAALLVERLPGQQLELLHQRVAVGGDLGGAAPPRRRAPPARRPPWPPSRADRGLVLGGLGVRGGRRGARLGDGRGRASASARAPPGPGPRPGSPAPRRRRTVGPRARSASARAPCSAARSLSVATCVSAPPRRAAQHDQPRTDAPAMRRARRPIRRARRRKPTLSIRMIVSAGCDSSGDARRGAAGCAAAPETSVGRAAGWPPMDARAHIDDLAAFVTAVALLVPRRRGAMAAASRRRVSPSSVRGTPSWTSHAAAT